MDDGRIWDVSPGEVLKWMAVVFVACLEVLIIIAIVLALFGVF
jgi:hypothetical protein